MLLRNSFQPTVAIFRQCRVYCGYQSIIYLQRSRGCLRINRFDRFPRRYIRRSPDPYVRSSREVIRGRRPQSARRDLNRLGFTRLSTQRRGCVFTRRFLGTGRVMRHFPRLFILTKEGRVNCSEHVIRILQVPTLLMVVIPINVPMQIARNSMFSVIADRLQFQEQRIVFRLVRRRQVTSNGSICRRALSTAIQSCSNRVFSYHGLRIRELFRPMR